MRDAEFCDVNSNEISLGHKESQRLSIFKNKYLTFNIVTMNSSELKFPPIS
jgi:hypothetical protein